MFLHLIVIIIIIIFIYYYYYYYYYYYCYYYYYHHFFDRLKHKPIINLRPICTLAAIHKVRTLIKTPPSPETQTLRLAYTFFPLVPTYGYTFLKKIWETYFVNHYQSRNRKNVTKQRNYCTWLSKNIKSKYQEEFWDQVCTS